MITTISTSIAPKTTPKDAQKPQSCDFNVDFCGWDTKKLDQKSKKWFLKEGSEIQNTGPNSDVTSIQSNYILLIKK